MVERFATEQKRTAPHRRHRILHSCPSLALFVAFGPIGRIPSLFAFIATRLRTLRLVPENIREDVNNTRSPMSREPLPGPSVEGKLNTALARLTALVRRRQRSCITTKRFVSLVELQVTAIIICKSY